MGRLPESSARTTEAIRTESEAKDRRATGTVNRCAVGEERLREHLKVFRINNYSLNGARYLQGLVVRSGQVGWAEEGDGDGGVEQGWQEPQ